VTGLAAYIPIMVLAIVCETAMLVFLYFISRFYEMKFGERTYYNGYLVLIAVILLGLAACALGEDFFQTMMLVNLLTVLVLALFGLRLSRMMRRVSK
jgi:hypothetical protein